MALKLIYFIYLTVFCSFVCGQDCVSDVSVNRWYSTINSNYSFHLKWELREETDCPIEYQVISRDEDLPLIQTFIVKENYILSDPLSPCTTYRFDISAINVETSATKFLGSSGITLSEVAQQPPKIKTIDITRTSFKISWGLEGNANRCPLVAFYVQGDGFNTTIPVQDIFDKTEITVEYDSLLPDTTYYLQAFIENSGGVSKHTRLAIHTNN